MTFRASPTNTGKGGMTVRMFDGPVHGLYNIGMKSEDIFT
jgi:hypothetical protein